MIEQSEYILLRKSITKEISRTRKELEKRIDFERDCLRNSLQHHVAKLTQQYNDCLKHLIIKRDNENAFIEEANKMKRIIANMKSFVD